MAFCRYSKVVHRQDRNTEFSDDPLVFGLNSSLLWMKKFASKNPRSKFKIKANDKAKAKMGKFTQIRILASAQRVYGFNQELFFWANITNKKGSS